MEITNYHMTIRLKMIATHQPHVVYILSNERYIIVREPVIGLIKWLRPKGLKMCSYVEKCAEFKNQTLIVHKSAMRNGIPRGMQYLKIALK